MRQQTRPFVVEVKHKRSHQKRGHSIWGDVDFSAALDHSARELEDLDTPNRRLIDSKVVVRDAEQSNKEIGETNMPDIDQTDSVEPASKGAPKRATSQTKKIRQPRTVKTELKASPLKNGAQSLPAATKAEGFVRPGRKVYSEQQRSQKLTQIETLLSAGATLKSAVKEAGTSEQTYYQWKKKASAPASAGDDLKDLVALEEENKRLKNLLAERLRKENAELKRRLGLQ